jgi:hypothetical protein
MAERERHAVEKSPENLRSIDLANQPLNDSPDPD